MSSVGELCTVEHTACKKFNNSCTFCFIHILCIEWGGFCHLKITFTFTHLHSNTVRVDRGSVVISVVFVDDEGGKPVKEF